VVPADGGHEKRPRHQGADVVAGAAANAWLSQVTRARTSGCIARGSRPRPRHIAMARMRRQQHVIRWWRIGPAVLVGGFPFHSGRRASPVPVPHPADLRPGRKKPRSAFGGPGQAFPGFAVRRRRAAVCARRQRPPAPAPDNGSRAWCDTHTYRRRG